MNVKKWNNWIGDMYVAILDGNGITPIDKHPDAGDPKKVAYAVVEFDSKRLDVAEFEYFSDIESLWIDGMQKWVVNTAYLCASDMDDDGIFIVIHVMNDSDNPVLLGRLSDGHEFTDFIKSKMMEALDKA